MVDETDQVAETFDDALRIALTVASQFGERISRLREQLARQREADARQQARELQARFDAERGAVRAHLTVAGQPDWWTHATPHDIGTLYETAVAWRDHDAVARDAAETIRREVSDRYGIDIDRPGADPGAVATAIQEAEHDHAQAVEERRRAGQDLTASQILLTRADTRDRDDVAITAADAAPAVADASVDRDQSAVAYDSAERRQAFARSLEGTGTEQDIHGRVLADTGNAKHPREAVTTQSGPSPTPRGTRGGPTHQRDRGGLSR
jgi:hypothetical protein